MTPPITFAAGELWDVERLRDGPLTMFWNQDDYQPCGHELDYGRRPRRRLIHRLLRLRAFRLAIRIAPAEGTDLKAYAQDIARILGVPYGGGDPQEGDRAVWLTGSCFARNAPQAGGVASKTFGQLGGLTMSQAQVHVELWRSA